MSVVYSIFIFISKYGCKIFEGNILYLSMLLTIEICLRYYLRIIQEIDKSKTTDYVDN